MASGRLEDQFDRHDRKSLLAQKAYKRSKTLELVVAATVPVLAALRAIMVFSHS